MNSVDLIRLAHKNLWRRKARTILTVVGVMIGTTAIVVMLSLGIGLDESQKKSMARWGNLNTIRVNQGMRFDNEGKPLGEEKKLDDEAVEKIRGLAGVLAVSPAYDAGGEAKLGRKKGHLQLIGIDPLEMANFEFTASQGRLLQEGDRNVIVVGSQVINNFMDEAQLRMMQRGKMVIEGPGPRTNNDPAEMLDQRVTMQVYANGEQEKKKLFSYTVVGILEGEFTEHAYQAYAPIEEIKKMRKFMSSGSGNSTGGGEMAVEMTSKGMGTKVVSRVSQRSRSQADTDNFSFILVRTGDVENSKKVSLELKDLGYNSWSMADQLEGIEKTSRTIQAILGGIGGITLLVAALGITNTMVMSIYERTREIGVMKVIGATFRDIHSIFLTEAGLIGMIGGTIGLGLSYLVSYIINQLSRGFMNRGGPPMSPEDIINISVIPIWLAGFAIVFAIMVGLLAGLYPANRAVRLSPVEAIRNE